MHSCLSYVQLFATQWTVARQASLSMRFSRPEYWSGLPCPPPGDLPDPGMEPASLMSLVLVDGSLLLAPLCANFGKYFYYVLATLPLPSIPSRTYFVQESLLVFMEITNTGWVVKLLAPSSPCDQRLVLTLFSHHFWLNWSFFPSRYIFFCCFPESHILQVSWFSFGRSLSDSSSSFRSIRCWGFSLWPASFPIDTPFLLLSCNPAVLKIVSRMVVPESLFLAVSSPWTPDFNVGTIWHLHLDV